MKNKLVYIVVIALVVLVSVGVLNREPEGGEVNIGAILPLSGGAAFLGESSQKAALLALEDAGDTAYDYQILFEDDAFTPSKTVTAANKLINVDGVTALITFGSGTSNSVAPINEDAEVVRFGLASDPTSVEGGYNFIHWTPAYKEGELMASEVVSRGYSRIALIDTNHSGTMAVSNAIKDGLKETNVDIVLNEITNVGDKDFRTIISKIKSESPELVILEMFSPEIELFARQMNEMGVDIPVTSVEAIEWSPELDLFEGSWFVSDNVSLEFAEHYKKVYGEYPKAGASYVYDIVSFIIQIQEDSNTKLDSKELADIINNIDSYKSEFFGEVEITDSGYFVTEASVKRVVDGEIVLN